MATKQSPGPQPGCTCSSCRQADRVYHFVCHDCAEPVDDAMHFHEMLIAGENRAHDIADSHWHENVELALVWEDRS